MSTSYRFPVMLWQNHSGSVAGRLLDADGHATAVGNSAKAVLDQLKEFIYYLGKNDWLWETEPDLFEIQMRQVKIQVYPEYRVRNRTFSCKDPILLKLPAAVGKRRGGLYASVLPTVDVVFDFSDPESFSELAQHYVRNALAGLAPRDIAPFLEPKKSWIEQLNVSVKPPDENVRPEDQTTPLTSVADHLGDREIRKTTKTWERDREVRDLVRRFADNTASICVVGATGCGKTSVLVDAAMRVERSLKEKGRRGARAPKLFWLTSAGRLVAGMRYLGQWEERLEQVIDELAQVEGVLCVENLLELVRLGGSGAETSIGAFLVPYLAAGELRLVAEATPEEIEACERLLPGLVDQLQIFKLEPFDEGQSLRILSNAGANIGANRGITFSPESLSTAFQLFLRFQPYSAFPGRAVHFLSEVADTVTRDESWSGSADIDRKTVRTEFGKATGLPAEILDDSIPLDPAAAKRFFSSRILGQTGAIDTITEALVKFKAGMNDPTRPLGVFLFAGPTGVGKTALVRALGDFLFAERPDKERLVRLDMSEYAGYDASRRLLGDPYGEPSELVRRIRSNPFTVLLLDEIEKAADEVFDIFMNVFEEGKLTDTFGRVTYFQSTLIVLTSNIGSTLSGSLGFTADSDTPSEARVDGSAVKKFFRPEFFNRLDRVVHFNPLPREVIFEITRNELDAIAQREGMRAKAITIAFTDMVVEALARDGFDEKLGARPLQRKIEESVTTPIAHLLVSRPDLKNTTVHIDLEPDGTFSLATGTTERDDA